MEYACLYSTMYDSRSSVLCREIHSKCTASFVRHAFPLSKYLLRATLYVPTTLQQGNRTLQTLSLHSLHLTRDRLPTMPPNPDPAPHPYRQISSHTTQSSHASATAISQIVLDDRPVMNRTSTPSCRLGQKGCGEQASALECGRKGCPEEKWGDRFADRAACI